MTIEVQDSPSLYLVVVVVCSSEHPTWAVETSTVDDEELTTFLPPLIWDKSHLILKTSKSFKLNIINNFRCEIINSSFLEPA